MKLPTHSCRLSLKKSLPLAACVFFAAFKSLAAEPVPILYYSFNNNKNGRAEEVESTGSSKSSALTKAAPPSYAPTNVYWSKKGEGVTGDTRDYALDFSKAPAMGGDATYGICVVKEAPLNGLKSFTLTGWFKSSTVATGCRLFDFVDGEGQGFLLTVADGKLGFQITGQGWLSKLDFNTPNEWMFFAVAFDGTKIKDNVTIYKGAKDGKLTSEVFSAGPENYPRENKIDNLIIGAGGGFNRIFQGMMDNMAIYGSAKDDSGALNEREIKAIMKTESKGKGAADAAEEVPADPNAPAQ